MSVFITLRAITPKKAKQLDMRIVERELRAAINAEVKPDMLRAFESTVRTWDTRVTFNAITRITSEHIGLEVYPKGEGAQVWQWLNDGTREHWVAPRRKRALAFQSGYTPKTVPGLVGSGPGGASGPVHFSMGHWVSGIEPRKWTVVIAREQRRMFKPTIESAFRKATR